ncbi:MAG: TRAP transporter small permease subunit [Burkholderiales bacterium]|nr:TRAP transporter small permease subunit [Burkholderiales bacterium]
MAQLGTRVVRALDRFTARAGAAVAWLNVPLAGVVAIEVMARHAFDAPTVWAFDLTYMLYAAIFMLGAACALLRGAHVRTDFFLERWSVRTRGIIDTLAYVLFFFPALAVLLAVGAGESWYAFGIAEVSEQTPWRPVLWPFKLMVPLACLLLIVQGVSETIKSAHAALTGVELERGERNAA